MGKLHILDDGAEQYWRPFLEALARLLPDEAELFACTRATEDGPVLLTRTLFAFDVPVAPYGDKRYITVAHDVVHKLQQAYNDAGRLLRRVYIPASEDLTEAQLFAHIELLTGTRKNTAGVMSAVASHRRACLQVVQAAVNQMLDDPAITRSQLRAELARVIALLDESGC